MQPGAVTLALISIAVLVAARGGGPATPGVASAGSSTLTTVPAGNSGTNVLTPKQLTALTQFAQCVRSHGISDFPDPPYASEELNDLVHRKGFNTGLLQKLENGVCRADMVASGTVETPAQVQQRQGAALKAAECMRAHGVTNYPDPGSNGGGPISSSIASEPGYATAAKTCGSPPTSPGSDG